MTDFRERPGAPAVPNAGSEVAAVSLASPSDDASEVQAMLAGAEKLFADARLDDARQAYLAVLASYPEQAQALNKLGIIAAREGGFQEAEEFFRRAVQADSKYAAPYSNLGNIRREQGDWEGALQFYDRALEIDPDYAAAYHNKGVVYRQLRRYDKAVPLLKKAARLEMKQPPKGDARPLRLSRFTGKRLLFWILIAAGIIFILSMRR